MATKKTKTTKDLRQLADALPPAYELHRSGGSMLKEKVPADLRDKAIEDIQKDPRIPKGAVVLKDKASIFIPHFYKAKVNHYKRLLTAYNNEGITGITKYLAGIKKIQEERRAEFQKQKDAKLSIGDNAEVRPSLVQAPELNKQKSDSNDSSADIEMGVPAYTKGGNISTDQTNTNEL